MAHLKLCTICLTKDVKLFDMDEQYLRNDYNFVSALHTFREDGMPPYLCYECKAYIRKAAKFREKCQHTYYTLRELLNVKTENNKLLLEDIDGSSIGITPSLVQIPVFHTVIISEEDETKDRECFIEIENACEPTTSQNADDNDFFDFADIKDFQLEPIVESKDISEEVVDEDFADLVPITKEEALAAFEIMNSNVAKYRCLVCGKGYKNETELKLHSNRHEKYVGGTFLCELCFVYFKTDSLLQTHMKIKHMFKYICKKCPEVNFDCQSAKKHYTANHLQLNTTLETNDKYEHRPKWLDKRGGKRVKGSAPIIVKKRRDLPPDFLKYTPVSHEDQYRIIRERQYSKNYVESRFKCELCFKGFRESETYQNHMKKHDPEISGIAECDICKMRYQNARAMYKHMITTHLFRYSCQSCDFVCFSRGQAYAHYKYHQNVTYSCSYCDKVFKKMSTHLTHVRIKHPSTQLCNICGHSFVSENGLYFHKRKAHSAKEMEESEVARVSKESNLYCAECDVQFLNDEAFVTHLGSSSKHSLVNLPTIARMSRRVPKKLVRMKDDKVKRKRARRSSSEVLNNGNISSFDCELCGVHLSSDVKARKHYEESHPGVEFLKRYMCDICGHATKQYANLLVHMRTHTREKPYSCTYCDRKFSMISNRNRHLAVHTGEKRFECEHCHRRFTQSSAVKLHIQTVHLKIPYAPWDKKNRKRRREQEQITNMLIESADDYINAYISTTDDREHAVIS